jgi:glycerate-2-kinase
LRRHLSAIKGGRLAAVAGRSVTWAISDDCVATEAEPDTIASGPKAGDATTSADAKAMLERHRLLERMPPAVRAHLTRAAPTADDVVAPGDPSLSSAAYWTVASRHDAMRAAATAARTLGYATRVLPDAVVGKARDGWRVLVDAARSMPDGARCVIASGETVVDVRGEGRGGRNQELALGALESLAALGPAALASIGTDGVDGFTDAAGAFVDGEMWRALGAAATAVRDDALARNDSYPVLERLGALVRTGPTGTNVADLMVLVTEPPSLSARP